MHIEIDLETLDKGPRSAIASIGAVAFDQFGTYDEFYQVIDLTCYDQYEPGVFTFGGDTIKWWLGQDPAAVDATFNDADAQYLSVALSKFGRFYNKIENQHGQIRGVWGNGATFDLVIMGNAYKGTRMQCPWEFYQERCHRTLKNLCPHITSSHGNGVLHNALDDARAQAEQAQKIMAHIAKHNPPEVLI